jgi:dienelactone hydrolase
MKTMMRIAAVLIAALLATASAEENQTLNIAPNQQWNFPQEKSVTLKPSLGAKGLVLQFQGGEKANNFFAASTAWNWTVPASGKIIVETRADTEHAHYFALRLYTKAGKSYGTTFGTAKKGFLFTQAGTTGEVSLSDFQSKDHEKLATGDEVQQVALEFAIEPGVANTIYISKLTLQPAPPVPAQEPTAALAIPWNLEELKKVPHSEPATEAVAEGVQAIYYQGLPFQGKPTKVFAYVGFPANASQGKVPGIILVHGGGGSAFASWVKLWNSRGYAAIAMDLCGTVPIGKTAQWQKHSDAGPAQQNTDEVARPIADQWMFHAVADVLLAHTLLASYPQVDANRIGITGISWGGVITCTVAGLDDRLKFAVPVYGCGFITSDFGDGTRFVGRTTAENLVQQWRKLWDPCMYLPKARVPMFWVTGTNDFAFTLKALQ